MQTNIETLENCRTILTLKADKEDWKSKIEKAYSKLEGKVSLKGFRKGKAPKELLRSKVNPEDVLNEALNAFLSENFTSVLKENNLSIERAMKDLNMSESTFYRWQRCDAKPLTSMIIALAKYFDVSVDYLVADLIK